MQGFVKGERPSVLWFDLIITEFYKKWQGKLIIDWPPPARDWARFASAKNAKFSITAILEDSVFHEAMPPWNELVVSRNSIWCSSGQVARRTAPLARHLLHLLSI